MTLADPNAASRRPEKKVDENKREVDVKENVNEGVLDRLDEKSAPATDGAAQPANATPDAKKDPKKAKPDPKKKPPKIPTPEDLAKQRTQPADAP